MATISFDRRALKVDIAIGLVAEAWAQACRRAGRVATVPTAVVPLKPQRPGRKSGVYRLEGVGEMEAPVVAKHCLRESAVIERQMYERILPAIGLPAPRFYGSVEDAEPEYWWLFVEDVGAVKLTEADRAVAAQWMARLHTSAAALGGVVSLPNRGVAHYREQLRVAAGNLDQSIANAELSEDSLAMLQGLRRRLDRVEARWDAVCDPCTVVPQTLVHGDFSRKNCRVRWTDAGPMIVALDWETAGWGPPAADLADWSRPSRNTPDGWRGTVALNVYASAVADSWPGVTLRDVEQQSRVGTIFRLVAAIRWASEALNAGSTFAGAHQLAALDGTLAAIEV
jgi:aminoglycoside phosphotransferase (APT) family kinase protein